MQLLVFFRGNENISSILNVYFHNRPQGKNMYGCRMKHTPIVYVKSMKEKYIQWTNKEGYLTNSMASCFK